LKRYKFIKDFEVVEKNNKKNIKITLKAVENPVNDIPEIKFYSKPSRPWYVSYKNLRVVAGGRGIGIISTNQGLMASHEAKQKKIMMRINCRNILTIFIFTLYKNVNYV
jgi:small subunit ribosomal protein S8